MISQVNALSSKEESIARVIAFAAWVNPVSIDWLKEHFTKIDPTGWSIIANELVQRNSAQIVKILWRTESIPGSQININAFMNILPELPKWELIRDKILNTTTTLN